MDVQKAKEEASPHDPAPGPTTSLTKQALFSSNAAVFLRSNSKEEQKREKEVEEEEEEDEEEDHFRHRRLTGDSGIEVCRCHVKREEQDEEEMQKRYLSKGEKEAMKGEERADVLHDSVDCSLRSKAAVQSPLLDDFTEQRGHIVQKSSEAVITVESL